MLLKSRASLTCFRTCFLPGQTKDLSAPRYYVAMYEGRIAGKINLVDSWLGPIVGLWTSEKTNLFTQRETWHRFHNVKLYFTIFCRGQNLLYTRMKQHSFALYKMQWYFETQYVRLQSINLTINVKGKPVPLQAWSGAEGSRKSRFPDFVTTAQDGGKVVSLTHRPPLPPGNAPGTHFC